MISMYKEDLFKSSIFAGFCIGIAGFGYLVNPVIGMFLFCIGLIAVVQYKLKLYTGTAGFVKDEKDMEDLAWIFVGNFFGCFIASILAMCSPFDLQSAANAILDKRLAAGWWNSGILSIACGFLMTTAVTFARKSKEFADWLPLLFGVPMFILCGFPHCIADTFYYLCCSRVKILMEPDFAYLYLSIILGNFLGCNMYKLFVKQNN